MLYKPAIYDVHMLNMRLCHTTNYAILHKTSLYAVLVYSRASCILYKSAMYIYAKYTFYAV